MKRWFAFLFCFTFLFLFCGCGMGKYPDISITDGQSIASETTEAIDNTLSSSGVEEPAESEQEQMGNVQICIRCGEIILYADMYDSELAKEFVSQLPQSISMQRVGGGREFYGRLQNALSYDEADAQTTFENGDLAYWFSGNGLCLLYNNQVDKPEIESGIIVFGKITSDLSAFSAFDDKTEFLIEIAE